MGNHTHRILNTTNAHAPVGYELVAFVFDLLCGCIRRNENLWLCFSKIFFDAKVLFFPQTPKYFSILFSDRQLTLLYKYYTLAFLLATIAGCFCKLSKRY